MKKTHASTEYPIVIKQIRGAITLSCPDFKQIKIVDLPKDKKVTPQFLSEIAAEIGKVWLENQAKLVETVAAGRSCPQPSSVKMTLEDRTEKLLSPPELSKLAGVSADTIRRAIDREEIPSETTSGGHRKVRWSSALKYLEEQGYSLLF